MCIQVSLLARRITGSSTVESNKMRRQRDCCKRYGDPMEQDIDTLVACFLNSSCHKTIQ